jgi:thiamine-phosphate pyrophosphorylase
MFHTNNIYYFIDNFDSEEILKLDKKINIIFRNYNEKLDEKLLVKIRSFCKNNNRKFYLANNIKLAKKLQLNGIYIPSFNKSLKKIKSSKNFEILGSAHNLKEIKIKENQGVSKIFLSPVFPIKKKKTSLNTVKFNLLSLKTNKKLIALGGINEKTIKQLQLLNCFGYASISFLKEKIKNKR